MTKAQSQAPEQGFGDAVHSNTGVGKIPEDLAELSLDEIREVIRKLRVQKDELETECRLIEERAHETEKALGESEERFRRIVETAEEGIWIIDAENYTSFVNGKLAGILGYPIDEIRGKTIFEFVVDEWLPILQENLRLSREGRRGQYDFKFRRKDGTELWVMVSAAPLFDRSGNYNGSFAMITDITDRKRVEEELREARDELEERVWRRTVDLERAIESLRSEIAERQHTEIELKNAEAELRKHREHLQDMVDERTAELEAFSYSVSHDLRAPLRSIDGFSLALLEDYADRLDNEGKDYLRRIRISTQRMGQLIDDLLTLSRVSRAAMQRIPVNLSVMASGIIAGLKNMHPERRADAVIQDSVFGEGDPGLMKQVLENLLGNAWKFTKLTPEARIEFGKTVIDGQAAYYVRDNGVGFDMRYVNKLFLPFQRLHSPEEFPGTGIGLAIVRRIIQRHGGRVWAEGEPGRGAVFYFTLL